MITSFTPKKTYVEGQGVSIVCNVTGSEQLNITWARVGLPSYTAGSVKDFSSISRHDEAEYQCTASNGDECPVAIARSTIKVIYKPENTTLTTSTKVACRNDRMTLTCNSHAKPAVHIYKFYRNGVLIANSSNGLYTYDMTVNGTNIYTCEPENIVGPGEVAKVTVQVKVTPIIQSITESQDVEEGSTFSLVCSVWDSSGALKVSWLRVSGHVLSNASTYTFSKILRSQTGSFECHASNGNECKATSKITNIKVKYQPRIIESSDESQTVDENDDITLFCKSDGYPKPTVKWTKEGSSLALYNGDTLIVKAIPSTKGMYKCLVSNGVGRTQMKEFTVNVVGYCAQHQCRQDTTCVSNKKSYYCNCTAGLKGRFCQEKDSSSNRVEIVLVFSKPGYSNALEDKSTQSFKDTEKLICDKMRSIFVNVYEDCSVIYFRSGSLESKVDLRFKEPTLLSAVEKSIKDAVINGTNLSDDLTLKDPDAVTAFPGTPCSKGPCKFDGVCKEDGDGYNCECKIFRHGQNCEKGIGLVPGVIIIVACFLLLLIIFVLTCLYCRRHTLNSYEKDIADYGTKMDEMRYHSTKGHIASSENYSFEEEYLRKGRYFDTTEKEIDSHEEKEINNESIAFQTFDKVEDQQPAKTTTHAALYTDIISAMMNTPDDQNNGQNFQETVNQNPPKITSTELNPTQRTITNVSSDEPLQDESKDVFVNDTKSEKMHVQFVNTKMDSENNPPTMASGPVPSLQFERGDNTCTIGDGSTMDPKESEKTLYPALM